LTIFSEKNIKERLIIKEISPANLGVAEIPKTLRKLIISVVVPLETAVIPLVIVFISRFILNLYSSFP